MIRISKFANINGMDFKHTILAFLREQFFDPIHSADENQYADQDRVKLRKTKELVLIEQRSLEQKPPAEMLRHLDDQIRSEEGKRLDANLTSLNLPNFTSIKIRLMYLKDQLGL